jgi:hypothetical protein
MECTYNTAQDTEMTNDFIITDMFKDGKKISEICRKSGRSRPYVMKILREHNLKSSQPNMAYSRGRMENSNRWAGGRSIGNGGYVRIKIPSHPRALSNGYVWEHILVAEKKLGRPLKYFGKSHHLNETVHHINGNKTDNRPENLKIFSNSQHIKHEWADTPIKYPQSKESRTKTPERYMAWLEANEKR